MKFRGPSGDNFFEHFTVDLRNLVLFLGDEGAKQFAIDKVKSMHEDAPVDTGELSRSIHAVIDGELVATSGPGKYRAPIEKLHRSSIGTIVFVVHTAKPTKGTVGHYEGGEFVFNYAAKVLPEIQFYERHFHPSVLRMEVDNSLRRALDKWLRVR